MNTKSIRFRIVLWYSITLFLATAFIFSSFYLVTRQILFKQVDKELASHANKLVEIATRQGVNMHELMLKQQLFSEFSDIPGMVVVLLDQNGSVVSNSLSDNNPYVSYKYIFDQAQNGQNSIYVNQEISKTPMRFVAEPIKNGTDLLGMVLVAHPIDAIQKSLNTLLATLGIVFFLLILPAVIGGRILAGKIMRPIYDITNKMDEISSEHLEERFDNPKSNDEIEKLVVTFNRLLDRLQDSFQRERQFIGDVAHELKTPVATLRSGIEITISKERKNEEYKKALKETLIDVDRLSTIIKNILDLAWLGADNAKYGENHFDLSKTLLDLKEIAVKLAAQKRLSLNGKIESGVIVGGAEDKIARAVLNVIDNAIKYSTQGASISLSLHKKNDNAVIEVKDAGIGIPKNELSHIFERFYRGSKAAKSFGSGLGLAIAQGVIKAHHGDVDVTSEAGKGTTVVISLPIVNISS